MLMAGYMALEGGFIAMVMCIQENYEMIRCKELVSISFLEVNKYEGNYFKDNKMHGKGILIHENGDRYIGKFKNNLRHGKGVFELATGEKYKGTFYLGEMHGYGKQIDNKGRIKQGKWERGKLIRWL